MSNVDLCWKAAKRLRTLSTSPDLRAFHCAVADWLDREGNQSLRAFGAMNAEADPQAIAVAQAFLAAPTPCPRCGGAGIVDTSPPGVDRHPWLATDTDCPRCCGEGVVDDNDNEES